MFNALNMENKNMKNIMKYICLFLMVIGISVEVKGEMYTESTMSMNIDLSQGEGSGIFNFIVKNSSPGWSLAYYGSAWIEAEVINHTDVVVIWAVNSYECDEYSCGTYWDNQYGQLPIALLYNFSSAGVYNVTVRVNETDYSTVKQTHDFTVTFNVTGSAASGYDVTYHVPSCVASPVNNTIKSETFAAPAPSVPGYKFEGWVTSPVDGQSQRPSTVYAAGDAVPSVCNAYALYSNVSAVFTRTNTLTSGKNYLIVGSYSAGSTANVISNEVDANSRFKVISWETSSDNKITCRDWSCIWRFDNPSGTEWTIYNEEVGKYAGTNGSSSTSSTDRAAALLNSGTDNAARWTCSVSSYNFTLTNKARASYNEKTLRIYSTNGGGFWSSSTGSNPYLFVQEELTPNYTTYPVCDANTYTVTYNANGASGSVPTDIAQYQAGDMVTVKGVGDLKKDCHTFAGWKCNKDDVTYTTGQTVAMGSSNMTFTAQWSEITSSLTVDEVGIGMSAGSITEGNSDNVTCGTELELAYTNIGTNLFCGWQVVNGSGTDVTESVVNGNTLTMPGYAITVSAHIFADVRWKCSADVELVGDVHLTSANGIEVFTTNFAEEPNKNIVVSMSSRGDAAKLRVRFLDSDDNEVTPANSPFALYYYGWTGSGTHNDYTQTYSGTNNYHYIDISGCADENFSQTFAVGYNPKSAGVYDTYKIKIEACNSGNAPLGNPAVLTLEGRSLPEQFVIAMKNTNDNKWYALPNDLATSTSESSSTKAPLLISVDNTTTPTKALMVPKNTLYKGDARYVTAHRNAIRFLRADATDNAWITTSSKSLLYMPDNGANAQDFNLRSSDLAKYTITQDGETGKTIAMYGGTIGWYGSGSNNTVYLLPVDASAEPAVFDVVEWFPTKLLIESSQDISTTSVQVGADEAIEAAASTATYGTNLYEVQTGDLTAKAGQAMSVSYTIEATTYAKVVTVPIILSRGTYATSGSVFGGLSAQSKYQDNDLVVRDGATLTVDATTGTWNKFVNVTIYPKSKVVVSAEKTLKTSLITMRGGYDEIYKDGLYTMGYDEPQLYLAGNSSSTAINYEKRVDLDQMHGMSVPFDVEQTAITYLNGASVKEGGNLFIDAYDGQKRADYAGTKSSWYYYDEKETPLYRGVGYTVSGAPSIETQNYAILRFPMATGWTDAVPGSESVAELEVYAWGHDAAIRDNHKGWNCLGNPYLANFGKADDATFGGKLYVGLLVETKDDKGNWTGGYHWNDEMVRYVTIPHDDGRGFDQVRVQDAVLKPFRHFFVQVKTTGILQFAKENIQNEVVARMTNNEPEEIELGILMSNGQATDNCGLLIGDDFSEGYEMMSDLGKELGQAMAIYTITEDYKLAFNAMNEDYAKGYIPVGYLAPKAGEYTISVDNDRYDIAPSVEHIYLLENGAPVADLKSVDYDFETTAGTNDDRFALNIVFNHNIGTDLSGADSMDEMPVKIVHNDKMYILMRGKVYSTTGKFIKAIKK